MSEWRKRQKEQEKMKRLTKLVCALVISIMSDVFARVVEETGEVRVSAVTSALKEKRGAEQPDSVKMDEATFSNLYVAKNVGASDTATVLTSGSVEFCTSNTPIMKHDGALIRTGRVENGVACFDFANLQIGSAVSVALTGDKPLLLASKNVARESKRTIA